MGRFFRHQRRNRRVKPAGNSPVKPREFAIRRVRERWPRLLPNVPRNLPTPSCLAKGHCFFGVGTPRSNCGVRQRVPLATAAQLPPLIFSGPSDTGENISRPDDGICAAFPVSSLTDAVPALPA